MQESGGELRARTKAYSLRVIHLVEELPKGSIPYRIGDQLLRCGTSVGANYRAACRARSPAEFCAKLGIVEEETDESLFWMELLIEAGIISERRLSNLMQEGNEILSMVVSSIQTARKKTARHKQQNKKNE